MPHQVEAGASVSYRSVFVNPAAAQAISHRGPISIDALTREIILEAATFGAHYRAGQYRVAPDRGAARQIAACVRRSLTNPFASRCADTPHL